MSDQTPDEPTDAALPSPTVALIDARLAELDGGANSIGLQQGRITTLTSELAAAEAQLAACLAEKADLERDRALLAAETPNAPADPTDLEERLHEPAALTDVGRHPPCR